MTSSFPGLGNQEPGETGGRWGRVCCLTRGAALAIHPKKKKKRLARARPRADDGSPVTYLHRIWSGESCHLDAVVPMDAESDHRPDQVGRLFRDSSGSRSPRAQNVQRVGPRAEDQGCTVLHEFSAHAEEIRGKGTRYRGREFVGLAAMLLHQRHETDTRENSHWVQVASRGVTEHESPADWHV